jgi:hypothetical protein
MFKLEEFKIDDDEAKSLLLNSHSIRKYAVTFRHTRCGVMKDEKDIRGRWKGAGPDAKVAEKL